MSAVIFCHIVVKIVELEQKDVKTLNEDQLKKLSRKQDVMEMLLRLERE